MRELRDVAFMVERYEHRQFPGGSVNMESGVC